jgi:hypothetical protein
MHLVLLFMGALSGVVGMLMLAYGSANYAAAIGQTLIVSGTTALAAGLIVVGLAAVVSRIRRLADALDRQPLPRIAGERFDVGRFEPKESAPLAPILASTSVPQGKPQPGAADEPQSAGIELPDTHQGIDAGAPAHSPSPVGEAVATEPVASEVPANGRRNLKPRHEEGPAVAGRDTEPSDPRPAAPDQPDAISRETRPRQYQPLVPPVRPSTPASAAPAEPSAPQAPPIILKSGVLDGMAYTLYSDGSIEAELPQGTKRFASIPELRAHIFEQGR